MSTENSHSLVKKTGIYALGTFGSKILTFLLVPLYSYYLNKEDFGYYDLVTTSINLIVPFLTLQISDSVFRWLITSSDKDSKVAAITNSSFIIIVTIVIMIFLCFGSYLLYPLKGHFTIFVLGIVSIIYPYIQQVTRGLGNSKMFAINGVIFTVIYLIGNVLLLVFLKLGINAIYYSTIIAYVISSIIIFCRIRFWDYLRLGSLNMSSCKEMLLYSIPLVPNTISWWLINSANKYIILFFLGVSVNGLFAMSNRFPVILVMINQVFTLAWQESAISNFEKKNKSNNSGQVLEKLIKLQFSLVVLLTLSSQALVKFFLSSEYYNAWYYMPILYLGVSFLSFSSFYGAFYLGAKKTKEIFTTTIYAGLINIVLALSLVKIFGLFGIAISTTIGYLYLFSIRAYDVYKYKLEIFDFPWKTIVTYSVMVIGSFVVAYLGNIYISLFSLVIFVVLILIENKNELFSMLKKVKSKF